jgi:OPA family sugar phosphate sensor protein UhpC-like MFS transporter
VSAATAGGARREIPKGFFLAFGLTWLAYASFYLCRKNFGVTKSAMQTELGLDKPSLVAIETAFLAAYALGQFVNGRLGDHLGARRVVGYGMLVSAALCVAFGFSSLTWVFIAMYLGNGLAQAAGWPGTVKAMAEWTVPETRGRVMGFWATCYQVGGLAATAAATYCLVHFGWRAAFWAPALWVAGVGVLVLAFLRPGPHATPATAAGEKTSSAALRALLKNPIVWCYGVSYFSLKLIRYSLLFWLPWYLERALGLSGGTPGYLSMSFEIGGVAGTLLIGYLSDRLIARYSRSYLAAVAMVGLSGALFLYSRFGSLSLGANFALMALVGALLFAADSVISGAAAQDVGGPHAAGMAAGIVNGVGSVGGILQGTVTVVVADRWGWSALFYVFLGLSLLGAAALIPTFRRPQGSIP